MRRNDTHEEVAIAGDDRWPRSCAAPRLHARDGTGRRRRSTKPMIGVVSMKGEQTPCNMTHDFQVDAAKAGIAEAGGTPREFSTISVSDGISMNHEGMKFSLLSRELIADFDRGRGPWPGLRCADRFRRLRQDASRRDDGNDPLQCAVDLHLWRQRAARAVRRANPHRARFLRGGRRLHDRRDRRGDA